MHWRELSATVGTAGFDRRRSSGVPSLAVTESGWQITLMLLTTTDVPWTDRRLARPDGHVNPRRYS